MPYCLTRIPAKGNSG
ncbi:hypothetical protein O9993_23080 [Vibrio lentus]|nr:hypothetical protein [Vibrio lentus]